MNRMFRVAAQLSAVLCLAPSIANAATPLSVYQSMVIPTARKYANQGFYYSGHLGKISPDSVKLDPYDKDAQLKIPGMDPDSPEVIVPLPDEIQRPYSPSIVLKNSYLLGGAIGYRTGNVRMELELSYHNNNARKVKGFPAANVERYDAGGTLIDPSDGATLVDHTITKSYANISDDNIGKLTSLFFMANLIYDYHFSNGVFPFIGIGLGGAYTELSAPLLKTTTTDYMDPMATDIYLAERKSLSTAGFDFAIQAIVGIGYVFTDHIEADLVYKYFETRLNDFGVEDFEHNYSGKPSDKDYEYNPSKVRFEAKSYGGNFFALEIRIH